MDRQVDLRAHLDVRLDERIERVDDAAADAVLDRHDPEVGVLPADLLEDGPDVVDGFVFHAAAELADRCQMAETAIGTEIDDAERLLQGERAAHQLAPDRLEGAVGQRPLAQPADLLQDRLFPVRCVDRSAAGVLDLADLHDDLGSLVEQIDDLSIELVNPLAQRFELFLVFGFSHVRPQITAGRRGSSLRENKTELVVAVRPVGTA